MLKTDANGVIDFEDGEKVSGDDFYLNSNGRRVLPIGTLLIQETKAPAGYRINSEVFLRQITDDGGTAEHVDTYNAPTVQEVANGALAIVKTSENGTLSGWTFRVTGPGYPNGTTVTTGADGKINLPNLAPGSYTIEEINVPNGMVQPAAQTVRVASMETATVRFENKYQRGDLEIVKTSENGTLAGWKFKVTGPGYPNGTTVTTDAEGKIKLTNIRVGSYTVEEIDVPAGMVPPAAQTVTVKSGETATVRFENKYQRGDLSIVKTSENGTLDGWTFRVTGPGYPNGTTVTTGTDGKITLPNIRVGVYTIEEIDVPAGMVPPAAQTVTVKSGETATVRFENKYQRGDLAIVKTSENGTLSGWTFRVTGPGYPDGTTVTTDAEGKITLPNIRVGSYTVEEIDVPDDIVPPEAQTVTVEWQTTATVSFQNAYKRGDLEITKTSEDGKLEGHSFKITGPSCPDGVTKTTDAEGKIKLTNIRIGVYTVEEIDVAGRYLAPENNPYTVTVEWKAMATVRFENKLVRGTLSIQKVDAETCEGLPLGDGSFSGVVFAVTFNAEDADGQPQPAILADLDGDGVAETRVEPGETVTTITTDENGLAALPERALPYGCYTVREISVPADSGYLLNDSWTAAVQICEEGEVLELEAPNVVRRGDFHFNKRDRDTEEPMAMVVFKVTSQTTGEWHLIVTDENGLFDSSLPHSVNTNANDAALNEDGTIDMSKLDPHAGLWFYGVAEHGDTLIDDARGALPYDIYRFEELSTPNNSGYSLLDVTQKLGVFNGVNVDLGSWKDVREPIPLFVSKVDVTGQEELAGAHIQVLDDKGRIVDEWTSTAAAHQVKSLQPGKIYTLRETIAPAGYAVTTDTVFSLLPDGSINPETTTATIGDDNVLLVEDKLTSVEICKIDAFDGKELSGAMLQVLDEQGRVVDEWVSSDQPHELTGLEIGKLYTLHESLAPIGYAAAADGVFCLQPDGSVDENTTTAMVDEEGRIIVKDPRTEVKISKVDVTDGEELPGATLQLLDERGRVIEEWVSTDQPHEIFGLETRKIYTLRETVAPAGYTVTADTVFLLKADGAIDTAATTTTVKGGVLLVEDAPILPPPTPTPTPTPEPTPTPTPEPTPTPTPEPLLIDVAVNKLWYDNNNSDGRRPQSVTIQLLADGRDTGKTLVLSAENGWTGKFTDLPQRNASGAPIYYSVTEAPVAGYTAKISGSVTDGFTVVNSSDSETLDLKVMKVWEDNNDEKQIRPTTVEIRLFADGVYVKTLRLSADKYWIGEFHDLPRFADGREIVYTIEEKPVEGYTFKITGSVQEGFTVHNFYPGTGPVTGDNSQLTAWLTVFGLSLAGALASLLWLRKKEQASN